MKKQLKTVTYAAWLLFFALAIVGTGCTPACESLANFICECEGNPSDAAACRNQVSLESATVNEYKQDTAFCNAKLNTCTCDLLSRGYRDACGLTRE